MILPVNDVASVILDWYSEAAFNNIRNGISVGYVISEVADLNYFHIFGVKLYALYYKSF